MFSITDARRAKSWSRRGVSELFASVLMIGVTLSLGSLVAAAALGQFGLASGSASLGASIDQASSGVGLSLVYVAVSPATGCPYYQGYQEGTSATVSVYNYGSTAFAPISIVVNSTSYTANYQALGQGSLVAYPLTLATCAHASGLTLYMADSSGDGAQFEA